MRIYTGTGDLGKTSIIGGTRVSKGDLRLESYGTLDELTAFEGELYNRIKGYEKVEKYLLWVINRTMDCAALIASDGTTCKRLPQISDESIREMERIIDSLLEGIPEVTRFTLPVGSGTLSMSHICRTICRRAERNIVRLMESGHEIDSCVLKFINRMSDFFYAMGRHLVYAEGIEEKYWTQDQKTNI